MNLTAEFLSVGAARGAAKVDVRDLPTLYIFFNRPDYIRQSFSRIREYRPKRLYLACDGSREDVADDAILIPLCRKQIQSEIDWDCDVRVLFGEVNRGRTVFIPMAIDWFFRSEAFGAVIEDDCVVSKSFFEFCFRALVSYQDDETICGVTGSFHGRALESSSSLFGATIFPSTWGWGTWSYIWGKYDQELSGFPNWIADPEKLLYLPAASREPFKYAFERIYSGAWSSWAYQLYFLAFSTRRRFLHPHVNLVQNIGLIDNKVQKLKIDVLAANPPGEMEGDLVYSSLNEYDEWQAGSLYSFD